MDLGVLKFTVLASRVFSGRTWGASGWSYNESAIWNVTAHDDARYINAAHADGLRSARRAPVRWPLASVVSDLPQ
jgi:hypothetical protein